VSSAASRQASPCCGYVTYTSSMTSSGNKAVNKGVKDSAYQTKESSVDMFDSTSRRQKSLPVVRSVVISIDC
jgi:hypothetical protein